MTSMSSWQKFTQQLFEFKELGTWIDGSLMQTPTGYFDTQRSNIEKALAAMHSLEAGAIANSDENRMVGHYWLRAPDKAPDATIRAAIVDTIEKIHRFTNAVHEGLISPAPGHVFTSFLIVGIGGSALGPQFIADALGSAQDKLIPYFLDNTDPDGIDLVLSRINLRSCLVLVISKSGSTKETRNGMLEVQEAFRRAGLHFPHHAVAVTGNGSSLDTVAESEGWLERFPMWDWVGGRTSVTSAVGLLPAALQGIAIDELLEGAAAADTHTRQNTIEMNPAAILALYWHLGSHGTGSKDMVMLPYKDRLLLFSRYLQQLIMESIGKDCDRQGNTVHQGLAVYGNKGSTDQHAYVQQLRDGIDNFFVTFIEVLQDRSGESIDVEPGITSGDYLFGFLYGTRQALAERQRRSMTITITNVDPFRIGMLIALFERAVGIYAELLDINAYHQPGVEAGKLAAGTILQLQAAVMDYCATHPLDCHTPETVATALNVPEKAPLIYAILRRKLP